MQAIKSAIDTRNTIEVMRLVRINPNIVYERINDNDKSVSVFCYMLLRQIGDYVIRNVVENIPVEAFGDGRLNDSDGWNVFHCATMGVIPILLSKFDDINFRYALRQLLRMQNGNGNTPFIELFEANIGMFKLYNDPNFYDDLYHFLMSDDGKDYLVESLIAVGPDDRRLLAKYEALQMELDELELEHEYDNLEGVSELMGNVLMENYHNDGDAVMDASPRLPPAIVRRQLNFATYLDGSMIEVGDTVYYEYNDVKIEDALVRKIDEYSESKDDYIIYIKNLKGDRKVYKVVGKRLQFRERVPRYETGEYAKLWDVTQTIRGVYTRIIDLESSTQQSFDGDIQFDGVKGVTFVCRGLSVDGREVRHSNRVILKNRKGNYRVLGASIQQIKDRKVVVMESDKNLKNKNIREISMDDILSMESPSLFYPDAQTKSFRHDRLSFTIPAEQKKDADGWITGVHPSEKAYGYIFSIKPPKLAFVPFKKDFKTKLVDAGKIRVKYRKSYSLKQFDINIMLGDYFFPLFALDVGKITFLGRGIYYNGSPMQNVEMNDVVSLQSTPGEYYKVSGIENKTLTIANNISSKQVSVDAVKLASRRVLIAVIGEMYPMDAFMDFRLLFPATKVQLHDPAFEPPSPDFSKEKDILEDMKRLGMRNGDVRRVEDRNEYLKLYKETYGCDTFDNKGDRIIPVKLVVLDAKGKMGYDKNKSGLLHAFCASALRKLLLTSYNKVCPMDRKPIKGVVFMSQKEADEQGMLLLKEKKEMQMALKKPVMSGKDRMMQMRIAAVKNLIDGATKKISGKKTLGENDDLKSLKELLPGWERKLKELQSQLEDPEILIELLEKQLVELEKQKREIFETIEKISNGTYEYPPGMSEEGKSDMNDYFQDLYNSFISRQDSPIEKLKMRIVYEKRRLDEERRKQMKRMNTNNSLTTMKKSKKLKAHKLKF